MAFTIGERVMCIGGFERAVPEQCPEKGNPPAYPVKGEELVIDGFNVSGYLVFEKYAQVYGPGAGQCAWDPRCFVPVAPMEEAIKELMESTITEPQLA